MFYCLCDVPLFSKILTINERFLSQHHETETAGSDGDKDALSEKVNKENRVEITKENGKEKTKAKPVIEKPKVTKDDAEIAYEAMITVSKITILIKYVSNLLT